MPVGATLPTNYRILIDGERYEVENLRIQWNDPEPNLSIRGSVRESEFTHQTGVYEVVFDEPGHPITGNEYIVGAAARSGEQAVGSLFTFSGEEDTTPPLADGLRLDTSEIFENDCGAKAILIRANLAGDSQGGGALPLLVRLESNKGVHDVWSSIARFGPFFLNGWLHDGTFFQDCIGPTGIESLELEGEVTVTFTLFDFAGNAAEPITQVVQWPEELGPQGDTGSPGGAGGTGSGAASGGGGCAMGPVRGSGVPLGVVLLLAMTLLLRRRSQCG